MPEEQRPTKTEVDEYIEEIRTGVAARASDDIRCQYDHYSDQCMTLLADEIERLRALSNAIHDVLAAAMTSHLIAAMFHPTADGSARAHEEYLKALRQLIELSLQRLSHETGESK